MVMILAILAYTAFFKDLGLLFHLDMADKAAVWLGIVLGFFLWLRVKINLQVVQPLVKKLDIPERLKMDRCFNY